MINKTINIVIPMAGAGSRFQEAGYTFPKPLIDINGKPMIQLVIENLKPKNIDYKFIFICQEKHYDKYSLHSIFNNLIPKEKFESITVNNLTQGAVCTVLMAVDYINNENDLIIANSDQLIDLDFDEFIGHCRTNNSNGSIMTFESNHPKWSYARLNSKNEVIEVAEKKVISNKATVGIYYFDEGKKFVNNAFKMIEKDIRVNNEFYVCPVYNEMIINNEIIKIFNIDEIQMHGLGTPEDLNKYLDLINTTK